MRAPRDLTGLIKFLTRDEWKFRLEEVIGEHFGPAMQAFDLECDEIGAALGGGWDVTLWGVAFEDFLGRQCKPDGRNFVDEYSAAAAGTNRLRPRPICAACATGSSSLTRPAP